VQLAVNVLITKDTFWFFSLSKLQWLCSRQTSWTCSGVFGSTFDSSIHFKRLFECV